MTRINLRPLEESDITDEYASWFENVDHHLDFFSGSGFTPSREDLLSELRDTVLGSSLALYGVELVGQGCLIGSVKIGPISQRHRTSDLVALIGDRRYAGKGLGVEAIHEGSRIAFHHHGVRKLHGGMFAANEASIRAYLAAGWHIEGRLRDHYVLDGRPMDRVLVACFAPPTTSSDLSRSPVKKG